MGAGAAGTGRQSFAAGYAATEGRSGGGRSGGKSLNNRGTAVRRDNEAGRMGPAEKESRE
jgi:hypothetical protein